MANCDRFNPSYSPCSSQAGTFDNTGKNTRRGPNLFNTDIALLKDTNPFRAVPARVYTRAASYMLDLHLRQAASGTRD